MIVLFICLLSASRLPEGYFNTSGHDIVDRDGNVVRLWGVNWFGSEDGGVIPKKYNDWNLDELISEVDSKGFNTWRIPISADRIFEWILHSPANIENWSPVNPGIKTNLEFFEVFVEKLFLKGHKLIF